MKKALLIVAALLMALMVSMAEAAPKALEAAQSTLKQLHKPAKYKEGVHYTVINQGPATSKPEITMFFSFYSVHSERFAETLVPKIKKRLPAGVSFNQVHVDFFGGNIGVDFFGVMARAFAVAQVLKVEDTIVPAIFNAIHHKRQRFTSLNDVKALFVVNGVTTSEFDSTANSFMVDAIMNRWVKKTENAFINIIPALIVNGKYRVETGAIKSYDDLLNIAFYLTTLK